LAAEEEKPAGKGFTVQDRRRFAPETGEASEKTFAPDETTAREAKETDSESASDAQARREPMPEIDFSSFVVSLSTQALMHLGEIANPLSGKAETDIAVAKQMIDILALLQEKTRGNLNSGEERLVEDILFDLRMKYVEAVKKKK